MDGFNVALYVFMAIVGAAALAVCLPIIIFLLGIILAVVQAF